MAKGTFTFPANFHVKIQESLDDRSTKRTKADLIKKESWPHDGDTIYVYRNMLVSTDDGLFKLIDPSKVLDEDYSGWEHISSSKVIDNLDSESSDEALSARQGKLLKESINKLEKDVSQVNSWKIFE